MDEDTVSIQCNRDEGIMQRHRKTCRRSEEGIALLIAIFVLLLISVVAIALLVSSGTETALGANYRSSSTVYYAALAGLEEARGRLVPKNPNYFGPSVISPGTVFPQGQTLYVLNRLPGETVAPWDQSNQFYDKEYKDEFGTEASAATWQALNSVWDNDVQGIPGPVYKWVRINAATERSIYLDVDNDGTIDPVMLYYNPSAMDSHGYPAPGLTAAPTPSQALEITAMAYLPNGSQKYLQYVVTPMAATLSFPAALTLDGNNVTFSVPDSSTFWMQGNDSNNPPNYAPPGGCVPGPNAVSAIGYTNSGDSSYSNIYSGLPFAYLSNYDGLGGSPGPPPAPSLNAVGTLLAPNLQTVAGLNSLVQSITQSADVVVAGPVTQSDSSSVMPSWMSSTNPATVVVNGDLTFNGWHGSGYGILLVTGQFTYDPDASWNGIVLVIGTGVISAAQHGTGQFNGAMLLATTVDASGNPLASLGSPSFNFASGAGGNGIFYSSCWIEYVQKPMTYKTLSFHEIRQ